MIAQAIGASVIAIDIADEKLEFARQLGAVEIINSSNTEDVVANVLEITHGGAHVSIDALGSPGTCYNSIANLRKRGKHIQVGLMVGDHRHPSIPMDRIIADELEILGCHGMQAYRYTEMLEMIRNSALTPEKLVGKRINLDESLAALVNMDNFEGTGSTVINEF